jgi:hypothetical protein
MKYGVSLKEYNDALKQPDFVPDVYVHACMHATCRLSVNCKCCTEGYVRNGQYYNCVNWQFGVHGITIYNTILCEQEKLADFWKTAELPNSFLYAL